MKLVQIQGLDRPNQAADTPAARLRGLRVPTQYKQAQDTPGTAYASITPTANSVTFTATEPGAWGNNIRVATAVGTLGVALTYDTLANGGRPIITVTAPATATLAANQAIVAAVNGSPVAAFVTASINGTGAAANAAVAAASAAGGSDGTAPTYYPVWQHTTWGFPVVVDIEDPLTAKLLKRGSYRYTSLGAVT
jgi:hypothetical protein